MAGSPAVELFGWAPMQGPSYCAGGLSTMAPLANFHIASARDFLWIARVDSRFAASAMAALAPAAAFHLARAVSIVEAATRRWLQYADQERGWERRRRRESWLGLVWEVEVEVTKRTGKPGCNTITCTSSAHGGKFHYFCFYCKGNRNSSLYLCGRSRACDRIKGSLDALRCCVTAGAGDNKGGDGYCTRELSGVECPQRISGRTRSDVATERSFQNAQAPIDLCGDYDD